MTALVVVAHEQLVDRAHPGPAPIEEQQRELVLRGQERVDRLDVLGRRRVGLLALRALPSAGEPSIKTERARRIGPLSHVNAVGIKIATGRYIACGPSRWIAFTNAPSGWGEPVFCVHS
jgi:hypothetical protein